MKTEKLYRKFQYAALKQVSRPRITKLLQDGKLKTTMALGEQCIIDCPENDVHFLVPKHNRKIQPKRKKQAAPGLKDSAPGGQK